MNKKITEALASKYNLIAESVRLIHGKPRGIYTIIEFLNQNKEFRITFGATKENSLTHSSSLLESLRSIKLVKEVEEGAHWLQVRAKTSITTATMLESIEEILEQALSFFEKEGYQSGSFDSGLDDGTVKLTQIDDDHFYLSDIDYGSRVRKLEEHKEIIKETSENIPLGVIGAILGASVGGALWTLAGHLGYIVWITGFLAIFLAFHGYKLFARKVSIVGAILVFLISIAVIVGANFVTWGWEFYDHFKLTYDVSFFEVLKETPGFIFSDRELLMPFIKDLAIGVGVLLIGGIFFMKDLYKKSAGHYVTKR